jgi:hypothetical protein
MSLRNTSPTPTSSARLKLVDELMDGYVSWREESASVAAMYDLWERAPRERRAIAYAAYVAALDREETAAAAYQELIERNAA